MKKGSHHTPEVLEKIRTAMQTPEIQAKISGDNNVMKRPEVAIKNAIAHRGQKLPSMMGDKNPAKRPEVRAKIAAAKQGDKNSAKRPEVRAKMSASHKGKRRPPLSEEQKIKLSIAQKGKKASPETLVKMSTAASGSNNSRWLGGISHEPYAWEFNDELKETIRRRDGYQCQFCGIPQTEYRTRLPVHHIDYDKKNSDPVNLIALCGPCNSRVNKNRRHWTAFFQAMMVRRDIAESEAFSIRREG